MQFRVSRTSVKDESILIAKLRRIEKLPEPGAVRTRLLSLDEEDDLVQNSGRRLLNGKSWHDPVMENPVLNSTEIWSFINPTDDSHPIHLHLARFRIGGRRKIENLAYLSRRSCDSRALRFRPIPTKLAGRTRCAHPGMMTRIIARFEGYTGRYVRHCHILEVLPPK